MPLRAGNRVLGARQERSSTEATCAEMHPSLGGASQDTRLTSRLQTQAQGLPVWEVRGTHQDPGFKVPRSHMEGTAASCLQDTLRPAKPASQHRGQSEEARAGGTPGAQG